VLYFEFVLEMNKERTERIISSGKKRRKIASEE
jgi:hypothetical protein